LGCGFFRDNLPAMAVDGERAAPTSLASAPLFAGRYAFQRELGQGATGRVLLVHDLAEGAAPRAIKIVPPEEGARLRWEFDLLAGIAHPNVAAVFELLRVAEAVPEPFRLRAGDVALVEQYVEGETADRMADALSADVAERLRLVVRCALALVRGLSAVHGAGMVHGDVKPSNMVVPPGAEEAVLIDLELARPPGFSTRIGGTPGYLAPEAWQGERSIATDLYAVGATLHRLLVGKVPGGDMGTRSVGEMVGRVLSRWRAGPKLPEGTPRALVHLVESLLNPDPGERPGSAREVVGRLSAVAVELGLPVGTDPRVAAAGAADAPTAAERAMIMRALPWVGEPDKLVALTSALAVGGVVAVVGPHGSGRSRLITDAIRALQEQCAEADRPVPTAVRVDRTLPRTTFRHHAVLHVQSADDVPVAEAHGLVRAAELEGFRLAVVLERRTEDDALEPQVRLGPLSDMQIAQLLACALHVSDPSPELVTAARDASGSLAGRLCRLLAVATAEGWDARDAAWLVELGRRAAVAADATIPPGARDVAELVAAVGGDLEPDHAVRALGRAGRFDLLVADGLATLTDEGRLHLRGDVVRSLRASMTPERRRAVALSLEGIELGAEARAYLAAMRGDVAEACERFMASVRHRRRLGSVDEAIRLASDALAEAGQGDAEGVQALRVELADALRAKGRYADATVALEGVTTPAARVVGAEVARLAGRMETATAEASAVLADAHTPSLARAQAGTVLARLRLDEGALDEAFTLAEQARELAVRENLDGAAARALEVLALVHAQRGEVEATGRLAAEAVARARRAGDRGAEARARSVAANVALRTGRVHAAARGQIDAFELAEAAGEAHAAATFLVNVGLARLDAGEPGPAIGALREGARRLARLGRERDLARTLYNLANAAAVVGDDDLAASAVARTLESARACGDVLAEAWALVVRADLALRSGNARAADEAASGAVALLGGMDDAAARVVVAARCAHCWIALGDAPRAADALAIARREAAEASDDPPARVEWRVAEVRAALHGGDLQGAREHSMAAWAAAEQSGLFEMRLRAGLALAEASRALGDTQAAAQALSEVRSLLDAATNTLEHSGRARMRAVPAYQPAFASKPDERTERHGADGRWRTLAIVAKRLGAERRTGRLYEQVLEAAMDLSGAERGYIVTRSDEGEARIRVTRGLPRRDLQKEEHPVPRSVIARVLDSGQPLATVDALSDEALRGAASIHALEVRSVLAVPFRVAGDMAAVIYLDDRLRPGAFGPDALELVSSLADIASVAIEGAERMRAERRTARRLAVLQRKLERLVEAQALEIAALKRTSHRSPLEGSGIVAESDAMRRVLDLAQKVASSDLPVLITGESGTGKELVARALHAHSRRRDAAFVTENCGAIPETLLESALFGHVRGAFTGADRPRMGLFEAADGGTLFLDEIGEMSPAMQAKLLRVVQDGIVRPVGSERTRKVDVRIVAATHRDLGAMVAEGKFREDLYYRLAVVTVPIPPLRDRPEDVPLLVAHFASKYGKALRIVPSALARLQRYAWPGNVRQLENEIQRAVVLAEDVIGEQHLSPAVLAPRGQGALKPDGLDLKAQVGELERRLITAALERTGGNQTRAAELLGVSRYGLQKMVRRLGIGESA
jgi:serine/threonine-protein kinase PknK